MYCSQCSHEMDPNDRFCRNCGTKPGPSKKASSIDTWRAIGIVCAVIAVTGIVLLTVAGVGVVIDKLRRSEIARQDDQRARSLSNARSTAPTPPPPMELVNDAFNLNARGWRPFSFTLNRPARVHGTFNVSGGHHKAQCLIMDSTEFENWKNSGDYRRYYDSGLVTNGKTDVQLAAGSYTIVYYNPEIFANKTVKTRIIAE